MMYRSVVPSVSDFDSVSAVEKETAAIDKGVGDDPEESLFQNDALVSIWRLLYFDTNAVTSQKSLLEVVDIMLNGMCLQNNNFQLERILSYRFFSFFFFSSIGRPYEKELLVLDAEVWTQIEHSEDELKHAIKESIHEVTGPVVFRHLLTHPVALEAIVDSYTLFQLLNPRLLQLIRVFQKTHQTEMDPNDAASVKRIVTKYEIPPEDAQEVLRLHSVLHHEARSNSDLRRHMTLRLLDAVQQDDVEYVEVFLQMELCGALLNMKRYDTKNLVSQVLENAVEKESMKTLRLLIDDGRFDPGVFMQKVFFKLPKMSLGGTQAVLRILLRYPHLDFQNTFNYRAFRKCGETARLDLIQVYELDPRIDVTARQNQVVRYAAIRLNVEMMRHFLSDPRYDPADKNNYAIQKTYENRRKNPRAAREILRMLLNDTRVTLLLPQREIVKYTRFAQEGV